MRWPRCLPAQQGLQCQQGQWGRRVPSRLSRRQGQRVPSRLLRRQDRRVPSRLLRRRDRRVPLRLLRRQDRRVPLRLLRRRGRRVPSRLLRRRGRRVPSRLSRRRGRGGLWVPSALPRRRGRGVPAFLPVPQAPAAPGGLVVPEGQGCSIHCRNHWDILRSRKDHAHSSYISLGNFLPVSQCAARKPRGISRGLPALFAGISAPIPLYAQRRSRVPPIPSPAKMEVVHILLMGQYICFNKAGYTILVIAACNIVRFANHSRNCIRNRYAGAAHLKGLNIIVIITKIDRFSF